MNARLLRSSLLAAALFAFTSSLTPAEARQAGGGDRPTAVVSVPAEMKEMTNRLEALGTLKANESVDIRPKVTGIVSEVMFDDGQEVQEGAILVTIDRDIESAEQKEAAVNVAEQRREYNRIKKLVKQGAFPASRLDEQLSKLKLAEATLEAQTARLGDRTVKTPFAGILGLRRVSPGVLVNPQTAIATLDDIHQLKLDFTIPEVHLTAVKEGQQIEARSSAYEDETFIGTVKAVESRIDPITRSATIRAVIPNEDGRLRPGMLLFVDLITSKKERLVVPEAAIVPNKEKAFVYVVGSDKTVDYREVKLGYRYPGWVEVESGLEAGERVVVEGTLKLRNGAMVSEHGEEAGE